MRKRLFLTAVGATLALAMAATLAATSTSPVADAAARGDAEAVAALLRDGADVNAPQGDGMTALHWSALNGDVEILEMVLVAGGTPKAMTRLGQFTPLHLASRNGHGAAVRALLEAGSEVGAPTSVGVRPIHFAAEAGSADAVAALLDHGADINARDTTHGRTPLVFATSRNRLDAMRLLIDRGADIRQPTRVLDYVEKAREDSASRSSSGGQSAGLDDPPDSGSGGGGRAGRAGRAGGAARGGAGRGGGGRGAADPDDPDDPPAQARGGRGGRGGGGGNANAPRALSTNEQIGTQGGFTALHYATRDGYMDAAMMLVDAGIDINTPSADKSSPMLVAIINGNFDIAKALLERGANPNQASDDGAGPLFSVLNNVWALRTWYPQPTAYKQQETSYLDMMTLLLEAGADPNARTTAHIWYAAYNAGRMGVDFVGATPFWRAAYALDIDAMRLLVEHGADPNLPTVQIGGGRASANDPTGLPPVPAGGPHVPPFHAASGVGYGTSRVAQQHRTVPDGWLPAARYFIEELGVDVNIRDADGFTALHHAAARGDNEMIVYLVEKGADVLVVNRRGQTTVDMANSPEQRTQPFPETIKLLEGMGAINNHNCQACK